MYLKHVSRLFSGMFQACFKIYTKHALNHHWNTLKHSWIILETCLKHAWNLLGTCLEHAWNILEICLKHAWIMLETCLKHAWNMLERLWKHSWTLLMLWMTLITHNTSRQKKGVDGRTNKRIYWHHHFLSCSSQLKTEMERESVVINVIILPQSE